MTRSHPLPQPLPFILFCLFKKLNNMGKQKSLKQVSVLKVRGILC